jgi:spermidine synthase
MFGATTIALAVVIAVFMAGMGFGGHLFGHHADHSRHPARMFALCNFGIAFSALIVFILINPSNGFYWRARGSFNLQGNPLVTTILIAIILMTIPTLLMGAILPLLGRIYISDRDNIGKGIGWLYATHTLGSIVGALITTYVCIPLFGHIFTYTLAMGINLIVGTIVVLSPVFFQYEVTVTTESTARTSDQVERGPTTVLLVIAGITGFCGLAFEMLWVRILRTYISNSTYSITNVLVIYLVGLTLGSTLFFKWLYRRARPWVLGASQLAIGGYALLMLLIMNRLPLVLFWIKDLLVLPGLRVALPGVVLSTILVLIPAVCMGITFPLLCRLYSDRVERLGQGIGNIYFINMFGGIAGSISAALILIPALGMTRSIGIVALVSCSTALLALALSRHERLFSRIVITHTGMFVVALIVFCLGMHQAMILPPSIFRSGLRLDRILHYDETLEGTVIVTEDLHTGIRACYINNNAVCGTTYDALKVMRMLGHLPCLFNPAARNACILGFGIGITTSTVAMHDLESIDCVEICPEITRAANLFSNYNRDVLQNETVHFLPGDGRIHMLTTRTLYDIISCDPTHPTLGCNNLYTREYFELCKDRLAQEGVVCQYLPLHKLSLKEFKIAIRTFASVFPHVTIWLAHSHAVMIGTVHEQHLNFNTVKDILNQVGDNIIHDPYDLACSLILDDHAARSFTRKGPINTDNHPYLEFFSPASTTKDNWDRNLYEMLKWRIDPTCIIDSIADVGRLSQYTTAQRYFLSALIFKNRGQFEKMLKALEIARAMNPSSEEIRFFLEHERTQRTTVFE